MASLPSPIDHYAGLFDDMRMLFTSQSPIEQPFEQGYSVRKKVSQIGSHPIVSVFESQIRGRVSKLRTYQFDSVHGIRIVYNGNQHDHSDTCLGQIRIDEHGAGRSTWREDHADFCGVCLKAKQIYCLRLSCTSLLLTG